MNMSWVLKMELHCRPLSKSELSTFRAKLKAASAVDERCKQLRSKISGESPWRRGDYLFDQKHMLGLGEDNLTVLLDQKVVIPENLKEEMLRVAHMGHLGREAMTNKIRTAFHWKGKTEDVDMYVARCHECARTQRSKPALEIARSRPPTGAFTEASADFFEVNRVYYLVMVCRLSNWFEVAKMSNNTAGQNTV